MSNPSKPDSDELYLLLRDKLPPELRSIALSGVAAEQGEPSAQALRLRLAEEASAKPAKPTPQKQSAAHKFPLESLQVGATVGPYRLKKKLGEGGMGTVFLASREENLQHLVALKTLHALSPKMREQFRAECRILSSLKHPHIAHLIDAGEDPGGMPWMAMEYVEGETLKSYLSTRQPGLNKRLELFLQICAALSHAHGQMIIHRDLNPGNIMVTSNGNIKLLDFGIAALLNPDTGQQHTVTVFGERMMTPEYASPEQVRGLRLSAGSDVYSLGVIFYELLTGKRPYHFSTRNPLEMAKVVTSAPITKPSSLREDAITGIPFRRLKGDLDTIALTAMEREPARRYSSVEAMAADIRHYLKGEPISAMPATVSYRLSKFFKRHPWPTAMGCLSALFLIFFSLFANQQRLLNAQERDIARTERKNAEAVSNFMMDMFNQLDPDVIPNSEVSAFEVLEQGRLQLDNLEEDEVRLRLIENMASVYTALGKYPTALQLQERLHEEMTALGRDSFATDLAWVRILLAAGRFQEAGQLLDTLQAQVEQQDPQHRAAYWHRRANYLVAKGWYPPADDSFNQALQMGGLEESQVIDLREDRAHLFYEWAAFPKALTEYEAVLTFRKNRLGSSHSKIASTLQAMGRVYVAQGEFEKAESFYDQVTDINTSLYGPDHPKHLSLSHDRVRLMMQKVELEEAETLSREVLLKAKELFGRESTSTLRAMSLLSDVLLEKAEYEEAGFLIREATALTRGLLGEDNYRMGESFTMMGRLLRKLNDLEEAGPLFEKALAFNLRTRKEHPHTASSLNDLGLLHMEMGNLGRARTYYERALSINMKVLGKDHPDMGALHHNLGGLLKRMGDLDGAYCYYQQALDIRSKAFGGHHPKTADTLNNMGFLRFQMGDRESAPPYFEKALIIRLATLGEVQGTATSYHNLGHVLRQLGDLEGARPLYEKALTIKVNIQGEQHPSTLKAFDILGSLSLQLGDLEQARANFEQALSIRKQVFGEEHPDVAESLSSFGRLLEAEGDIEGAAAHHQQAIAIAETRLGPSHRKTQRYRQRLDSVLQSNR